MRYVSSDTSYDSCIENYSNGRVQCTTCNILIADSSKNIDDHLYGRKHSFNTTVKLMRENGISECDDKSFCKICKEYFPNTQHAIQGHVYRDYHFKWMDMLDDQFLNLEKYLSSAKCSYIWCNVCNCKLTYSHSCINEHIFGSNHKSARLEKLMSLNGVFYADDGVWCKPCKESIDDDCILIHVTDNRHCKIVENFGNLVEDEDISIDAYFSDIDVYTAFCSHCNVPVPCTYSNLEEHIYGYRHSQ